MRYWIATLHWSQTDHEKVILQAVSREAAQDILRMRFKLNPRYIDVDYSPARLL